MVVLSNGSEDIHHIARYRCSVAKDQEGCLLGSSDPDVFHCEQKCMLLDDTRHRHVGTSAGH